MDRVPEVISNFNLYKMGNKFVGVTGSVAIPPIVQKMVEITGAGILGTYNTAIISEIESMEMEITFRMIDKDTVSLADPTEFTELTLRMGAQSTILSSAQLAYRSMRVVTKGKVKEFDPGKVEKAGTMDAKIKQEVLYLLIEMDGQPAIEIDKLNFVYKVNGKDVLKEIREMC